MTFQEKVAETIERQNSLLCVGLDTDLSRVPEKIKNSPNPLFSFNKAIIDATTEYVSAYKVNLAFYEAHGAMGWQALEETFHYIPDHVLKIADAKRGDIGNTARLYARSLFEHLGADAVTVNPYMGFDSVAPFLERPECGVFLLCLTSNPGARDFQFFTDGKQKLYEKIAATAVSWNTKQNCGLVVGATHSGELASVRRIAGDMPFLIPGIGAQGGDLVTAVRNGTNQNGSMALFNSSRSIIYVSNKNDFYQAAGRAAKKTRDELNKARSV